MKINEIITDEQLDNAFGNSNFGTTSKRDIVKYALLRAACKYHNGYTATSIIQELGLVGKSHTKKQSLTELGKQYLWECFGKSGI